MKILNAIARNTLLVVLLLSCVLLLVSLPITSFASTKYKFAVVPAGIHPFWNPAPQAAKDAARDLGIPEPVYQAPQLFDQNEQNIIVDALIAKGYNGFAFQTADPVAGNATISRMVARGIPVVTMAGPPAQPTKALYCLATDVRESAYKGTKHLIETLGGKGRIVHLTGQLSELNTKLRMEGVKKAVGEHPGVELIQTITDIDVAEAAQNAVSALLAARRSEIDGIIATGYIPSVTVANEFRRLNERRIKAVGIDMDEAVLAAIKDGYMVGTMSQNPYAMVYLSIYTLKLLADGYTWKQDNPFLIDSGSQFIDKSNVDAVDQMLAATTKKMFAEWKDKYFNPPKK